MALAREARRAAPQDRRGDRGQLPEDRRRSSASRSRGPASSTSSSRRAGARPALQRSARRGRRRTARSDAGKGTRVLLEFVSANPTGPLVIVNARAAAVGDALARILRSPGLRASSRSTTSTTRATSSRRSRARWTCGCARRWARRPSCRRTRIRASTSIDLVAEWLARGSRRACARSPRCRRRSGSSASGARRSTAWWRASGACSRPTARTSTAGPTSSATCATRACPERRHRRAHRGRPHLRAGRGALVPLHRLRRRQGPRAAEVGRRADLLRGGHRLPPLREVRAGATTSSTSSGPITTATSQRMRAAMQALGHPPERFDVLIVQLVTLLRDGQPVRMSKRRGEFVLMEELLEEVGRDAARFTFLTRRHDSPLEFDLAVATRQSADNPVFYVQYAHARVASLFRTAAEQGVTVPPWDAGRLPPARAARGAGAHQAAAAVPGAGGGRGAGPRAAPRRLLPERAGRALPSVLQGPPRDHGRTAR